MKKVALVLGALLLASPLTARATVFGDGDGGAGAPPGWDKLSPEVRAKIEQVDEARLQAIGDKVEKGETLTDDEREIADAFQTLAIAAFDHPEEIAPLIQWGIEAKLPYVNGIPSLPGKDTMADEDASGFLAHLVSYQHPDHDTETWPPEARDE